MSKNRSSGDSGPKQRQLRVGETIRRALSEVLARGDIHDPDLNRFSVTVGEVRVSPDLKVATAFVVPLGGGGSEELIKALARNKGELRHHIAQKLTIKYTPDLRFRHDDTFDRLDETRRLFSDQTVQRDIAANEDDGAKDDAD